MNDCESPRSLNLPVRDKGLPSCGFLTQEARPLLTLLQTKGGTRYAR